MLVGTWRKMAHPDCAALYPAVLQFDANGLYHGAPEPPGQFTSWDVGTWRIDDPGHVMISTANDAVIRYAFALTDAELTVTDQAGCRFTYRREA